VLCSVVAPVAVFVHLMRLRQVSRAAVLGFGLFLLLLSALHLLPLASAGIGINMVSQVLLEHLRQAERNHDDAPS